MATLGRPSIATPNTAPTDANRLKPWQQAIDNIRERFGKIEAAVTALETVTTERSAASSRTAAAMRSELRELLIRVETAIGEAEQLLRIFSVADSFEDGDIWVYRDAVAQFVPEPGGDIGGGAVLPVVTGEVPPVLVYLDDGSLVYSELEA